MSIKIGSVSVLQLRSFLSLKILFTMKNYYIKIYVCHYILVFYLYYCPKYGIICVYINCLICGVHWDVLQFVFGRPASGKTYTVMNRLKELSLKGKESILIVPEQFTFESERLVLKTLGDKSALFVNVISFTRLYDEIGRNIGGIAGTVLRDSDKLIFMNRTLKGVADELKLWGRYVNSVNFAKTLLDTVGEFKINAVTPEDLKKAAEEVNTPSLRDKLLDIALIYENYDALVGEKFIDPADTLTKIYDALKQYEYFKGKTVILDSFKGFTGQQYKIIERIFSQADDVIISLTDDITVKGEYCVYANIRKAVKSIEAIAKSRGVKIAEPLVLGESRYNSNSLIAVERLLAGIKPEIDKADNSLCICKAQTVYDEAEFAARTIRKLVRTENYRYRDFVIIARDSEKYESAIESACKRNNVNCFYDSKIPLSAFPLSVAGRTALQSLNFSTDGILSFHKTGLGTLTNDEISILENYTYIWNITGDIWEKEWDMDPRGLTADEDNDGIAAAELSQINRLREICIKPISAFKKNFGGSAKDMAEALVKLFYSCDCSNKLNRMCEEFKGVNNSFYADALKQSFDEYMKILDSLVLCFGDAAISRKEFSDALELAVALGSVGVIPQTLDEVAFGAADRIRPSRPKIAFILGANQGEFPKTLSNSGIFALTERKNLIENGINIADNAIDSSIDENYLVYSNLCCASDKLFISYCEKTVSGEAKEPAAFVEELKEEAFCKITAFPSTEDLAQNAPETAKSAFGEYCRLLKKAPSEALGIKKALDGTELSKQADIIALGEVKKNDALTPDTARKLYGNDIYMSATKFDTFNRCHFSFFCRYGLKVEKLQTADFNVLQRGTIVHYVLERIISCYRKGISNLEYTVLDELTDRYIEEYLEQVGGFSSIKDAKTEFLISRISRSLKEVVRHISDEMKQSEFEPVACELKIGRDGEVPAMRFPFDGGDIVLNGSIDRVDRYNGYIRIIDYKTGSKSFKLPDILVGLNMQMLLYLYCVVRGQGIPDEMAAGILYKPSKRDTNDSGMAMNGLIPADEKLVKAMDKEGLGEFVPKLSLNKDGSVSKRSDSFIDSEKFTVIFDHIEKIMKKTGDSISSGDIGVTPINGRESDACKYCDYSFVCGIEDSEIPKVEKLSNDKVLESLKEDKDNAD